MEKKKEGREGRREEREGRREGHTYISRTKDVAPRAELSVLLPLKLYRPFQQLEEIICVESIRGGQCRLPLLFKRPSNGIRDVNVHPSKIPASAPADGAVDGTRAFPDFHVRIHAQDIP